MVLFTRNVKKIKGAAHKNGEVEGMCKRAFNCAIIIVRHVFHCTIEVVLLKVQSHLRFTLETIAIT